MFTRSALRNRHFNRRAFMSTMGLSALAAPFISSRGALAQSSGAQNLVILTWPEGLESEFAPSSNGLGTELVFSDILAPLQPHQAKLLIVHGLKSGIKGSVNAHSEGPVTLWTGCVPSASTASLPSIDQIVAESIAGVTPYRSLHFGAQTNVPSAIIQNDFMFYEGPNQGIAAEDDPLATYNAVFGSLPGSNPAELERLRAERRSVLDFASAELKRIKGVVAANDRSKVDAHLEGIRAIETGLDNLGKVSCEQTLAAPTLGGQHMLDQNFPAVIDTQLSILTLALQCQLTKVATIQLSNTDSQTRIPGVNTGKGVHDIVHTEPKAAKWPINKFFMQQFASLLSKLDAVVVDAASGRTLLDETVVVAGSEMAIGNHHNDPMKFFIAGGGNTYFKLGRYLDLPGLPRHTKLLTSIAHAFGRTDLESIGQFTEADALGIIPELQG